MKSISQQSNPSLSRIQKEEILKKIIRKWVEKAKQKGLTYNQRRTEKKLRREVMACRRTLRMNGTQNEKKRGHLLFGFGTIEWLLLYAPRGQNEGINGIVKKRGNVIGDGQDTSWSLTKQTLKNRCGGNLTNLKGVAFIYYCSTGQKKHSLRTIYNWKREKHFFILIFWVIFSR